jgi:hypothetical protein
LLRMASRLFDRSNDRSAAIDSTLTSTSSSRTKSPNTLSSAVCEKPHDDVRPGPTGKRSRHCGYEAGVLCFERRLLRLLEHRDTRSGLQTLTTTIIKLLDLKH